jgi:N utilization substance protein A
MDQDIINALTMIAREKKVDREIVIESLVAGLQSAAKKKLGLNSIIDARVDGETGDMLVEQVKTVVEEVEDDEAEISLEEARDNFGDEVQPGDEVRWELPLEEFGRNAILVAKQILVQKVREAERNRIFERFKDRVGEVIQGTIQQADRGNVLVMVDGVEALLPYREQIRGEPYRQSTELRSLIVEVLDNAKGPQIILSRSHPDFLKRLFEQNVPEIQEGIVEIKAVAREPGSRSKIAVISHDDRVDAVGSCVGMKGSRVQAVTRELHGERIDIVPYSGEPSLLISRALSPAEVSSIQLDSEKRQATVIVAEDQLSKAIGKEGKNVRLAAKLTEWRIDLVSSREHQIRQRVAEEMAMELEEMSGVTQRIAGLLQEAGIYTIEQLASVNPERLLAIPGIGPKTADQLQATAVATNAELSRMIEEAVTEELASTEVEERPLFDESVLGEQPVVQPAEEEIVGPEEELVGIQREDLFQDFEERLVAQPEEPEEPGEPEEPEEAEEPEEPELTEETAAASRAESGPGAETAVSVAPGAPAAAQPATKTAKHEKAEEEEGKEEGKEEDAEQGEREDHRKTSPESEPEE